MPANLIRQAAFRPSSNPTIGLILELSGGTQIAVLQSQLASLTADQVQVLLRTATDRVDIYVQDDGNRITDGYYWVPFYAAPSGI